MMYLFKDIELAVFLNEIGVAAFSFAQQSDDMIVIIIYWDSFS